MNGVNEPEANIGGDELGIVRRRELTRSKSAPARIGEKMVCFWMKKKVRQAAAASSSRSEVFSGRRSPLSCWMRCRISLSVAMVKPTRSDGFESGLKVTPCLAADYCVLCLTDPGDGLSSVLCSSELSLCSCYVFDGVLTLGVGDRLDLISISVSARHLVFLGTSFLGRSTPSSVLRRLIGALEVEQTFPQDSFLLSFANFILEFIECFLFLRLSVLFGFRSDLSSSFAGLTIMDLSLAGAAPSSPRREASLDACSCLSISPFASLKWTLCLSCCASAGSGNSVLSSGFELFHNSFLHRLKIVVIRAVDVPRRESPLSLGFYAGSVPAFCIFSRGLPALGLILLVGGFEFAWSPLFLRKGFHDDQVSPEKSEGLATNPSSVSCLEFVT
ncbi:hypothetical protein Bca4012_047345 [Brassica carinata]